MDTPAPYQGLILVSDCVGNAPDFPRSLQHQALALLAQSVQRLVRPNAGGAVVWVTLADANPLRPESTISTLTIPATPTLPPPPILTPTPTLSPSNPYASAAAQTRVEEQNQAALRDYQQRLTRAQDQIAHVAATVRTWATTLRSLTPPPGQSPANLSACVALASQRMNAWPGATKYLIVAAPLSPPTGQLAWYSLAHTHLRWVDMLCPDLSSCVESENAWGHALAAAGVTDQRYFDPGESQVLNTLLTTPTDRS